MQGALGEDEDLLARIVGVGIQALMEAERDVHVDTERFERTGVRRTQRNGYKGRTLVTRVGTLELRVPQTRDGQFYPSVLERYQHSEGALTATLAECWVQGVSTRKVAAICRELFGDEVSHEAVSQYAQRLDKELGPWRTRPLEGEYPYVFLDGRYEKVRVERRAVDLAVLMAIGANGEGRREVLGVEMAHGGSRATWSGFLEGLLERGLKGVRLAVSDAHAGLQDARRVHFSRVPWQRCQRHFLMNALERVPKAMESWLQRGLGRVSDEAETHEAARMELGPLSLGPNPEQHPGAENSGSGLVPPAVTDDELLPHSWTAPPAMARAAVGSRPGPPGRFRLSHRSTGRRLADGTEAGREWGVPAGRPLHDPPWLDGVADLLIRAGINLVPPRRGRRERAPSMR